MQTRNAIRLALIMSGKYDLPGQKLVVKGYDAYGKETREEIAQTDTERLERDVDAILAGTMPSPVRVVDNIAIANISLPPSA